MHDQHVETARELLTRRLGRAVSLVPIEGVSQWDDAPNTIIRCRLDTNAADDPSTVVLKWPNQPNGFLYSEWAALEFLGSVEGARDLVPRFYGGDPDLELLVVEDLGSADQLLGDILDGDDRTVARDALLSHQRALGRLHGATVGRGEAFHSIRDRFPDPGPTRHRVFQILDALGDLESAVRLVDATPPPALAGEVRTAIAAIEGSSRFHALVHGDATPANAFVTPRGVKLYDWETARFRHAFLDGAFSRIRYLHSVLACRIPEDLRVEASTAYREALVAYVPEVADDAVFWPAYLACSLGWLAGLSRLLPRVLEADVEWGQTTFRQRVAEGLAHFHDLAVERDAYPAAAEAALRMSKALHARWPAETLQMQPYRAFA